MKQINQQESFINLFAKSIADPSVIDAGDALILEKALERFPYCQVLNLFYSRSISLSGSENLKKQLSDTALSVPERKILYTILKEPEKLKDFNEEKLKEEELGSENVWEDPANHIIEKISSSAKVETETDQEIAAEPGKEKSSNEEDAWSAKMETVIKNEEEIKTEPVSITEEAEQAEIEPAKEIRFAPAEDLSITEESTPEDTTVLEERKAETEQKVSKYNDDKMPYSFLWWLQKTRMEYAETYQPYSDLRFDSNQHIKISSVDQLSSQIIENIFHLQSPLEQVKNAPRTVPFQVKRKEDSILEKFIREEPQIRPPDSQKLNTENKARKSAEDPNDLVSETLAHIYTDQMLYEKAIATYKKLSLKYPEKSTYFADRIRELEKKVN